MIKITLFEVRQKAPTIFSIETNEGKVFHLKLARGVRLLFLPATRYQRRMPIATNADRKHYSDRELKEWVERELNLFYYPEIADRL